MKQIGTIFLICSVMVSCNSQINVENIEFGEDISKIINLKEMNKESDLIFGLSSYKTEKLNNLKYGKVIFSDYSLGDNAKNSSISYHSSLSFLVDNYNSNKLSGFLIGIDKEEEGNKLLDYLKVKLGKPLLQEINKKDKHLQSKYLWDSEKYNQLVYINQYTEYYDNLHKSFITTKVTIVKRGITLTPDAGSNPESIKNILEENPHAFDVIEILKSTFQNKE